MVEKFYKNIFLPSQDDPFHSFGCHIALSISDKIPMSVNNDLDLFYENMNDGLNVNDKHSSYSFLSVQLTGEEYRQFEQKDPRLLKTLRYVPNYSSLTKSASNNDKIRYIHHLCKRQTIILKPSLRIVLIRS